MLRVFIGFDERQSVAYNVCRFSIERRASIPVTVSPLRLETLPITRSGLTFFTFSRFLVPWLCGYEGNALFLDSDFLVLGDIKEVFDVPYKAPLGEDMAVWVSKNPMKFEWASMILFNCSHPATTILTPDYVQTAGDLHRLSWLRDDQIGDLPREWNVLAGYDVPIDHPKAVHFTQGLPIFQETEGSPYAEAWKAEHKALNSTLPWQETMGTSVHAAMTADGRRVAKLHKDSVT